MNTAYPIRKIMPSLRVIILPVYKNGSIPIVAIRRTIIRSKAAKACRGISNADKPRIKKILNTFDPRIFPTMSSDSFFCEAVIDTISSGRDVPTAMTVKAIKNEEIPKADAIETVDSINNHAPRITPIIPKMIKRIFRQVFSIPTVSRACFFCLAHPTNRANDPIKNIINNPPPIK